MASKKVKNSPVAKAAKKTQKAARVKKTESAAVIEVDPQMFTETSLTEKVFLERLSEKLTHFDASMILEAAMLSAGVSRTGGCFKKGETRDICLALIKRGGPAFAVGAGIYREFVG